MSELRQRLRSDFRDFDVRHDYTESFLNSFVASQIRKLRKARRLTQKQLAEAIGTKQSGVSAFEDASHEGWQLSKLQKMARAFDVALVVRFESFGNVLGDIDRYGPAMIDKPAFKDDPIFQEHADTQSTTGARVLMWTREQSPQQLSSRETAEFIKDTLKNSLTDRTNGRRANG